MSSHHATPQTGIQRRRRLDSLRRSAGMTMLCLLYVITSTGMLPQLQPGKGCHCAEQSTSSNDCCCINKTASGDSREGASCCTARRQKPGSCCNAKKKKPLKSQKESPLLQLSRACGCGDSSENALAVAFPRNLHSGPALLNPTDLQSILTFIDVLPVTMTFSPDTPPPRV
ncbi:hypothetical protein [Gimesia maris]|uniref:hypothetical protein n=1 Tax=Gimesia maris TaxID=122 RepID=UPI0011887DCF|nr:hypothetical protein [Gimesia maris]QDU14957.1 hypothetical protein CA11_27700 [Gimesia maris]